jgi:Spy/CpxP family protein refolding chaperone
MRSVLKNKALVTIIGILLLANIGMLVFLVSAMKKPDRGHPAHTSTGFSTISYLQSKIGFSDKQIDQLEKLKGEHHQKLNPLFEDLRTTKDQFFLLVKESPSEAVIDSLTSMIGEKQKRLDMQVFHTIEEVRNICTPEQQVKFDSLLPKIAYKMAGHIRKGNIKEDALKKPH